MEFNWNTETMSPSQFKIADYIQKNTQHVLLSTEQEISNSLKISIASVSRFWRSVGYKNFKDFKTQMRTQLEVSPAGKMKNIMRKAEGHELQYHKLTMSVDHLQKTMEHFSSNDFDQAVDTLSRAHNIYIYCPGPSIGLGHLLYYRLSRFGLHIRIIHNNGSELFEDLLHINKNDVVIIFGFVRLLPEAKVILDQANQVGYQTIIITDKLVSDFSTQTDSILFASRGDMWEFHSMIAPTFMVENLIIAVGMKNKQENLERLELLSNLRHQYSDILPR
ncbi:MurR/RpiR family transcriptional regulator [Aquibacillus rhizosphaerae]|uniref:MurR/RpiR family transcriptional regulator n=1 Tax=Aquibacillus rhizosphaerae TaxID=3051431 RepID=A0ABT7L5R3_9BACI|nr:MurR/RpiR family transcriptional regulator [Aquibacillus sp. LR5S19]MDL4841199.1 MurR/RpiR family transcriptional regulator [Aquibacillus sp. LR5S19]